MLLRAGSVGHKNYAMRAARVESDGFESDSGLQAWSMHTGGVDSFTSIVSCANTSVDRIVFHCIV
jgi:hypothetical protein